MKINLKNKRELLFIICGVFILLAIIVFFVYSINFLILNLNAGLTADSSDKSPIVQFDLDGLRKLGITD